MILVAAGSEGQVGFEASIMFAGQLTDRGYSIVVDDFYLPLDSKPALQYEAAKYLSDISVAEVSQILVIGGDKISDTVLNRFKCYRFDKSPKIGIIGRFESFQQKNEVRSRTEFALGITPTVFDLTIQQPDPLMKKTIAPLFSFGCREESNLGDGQKVMLVLPPNSLELNELRSLISSLKNIPDVRIRILDSGDNFGRLKLRDFASLPIFEALEVSPSAFSRMADIVVFFGDTIENERLATFAVGAMGSAKIVVDATHSGWIAGTGAPAVRGPADPRKIALFLQESIISNKNSLIEETNNHSWIQAASIEHLEDALSLSAPTIPQTQDTSKCRIVFVPTNGVGLGHARRCSLVADVIRKDDKPVFAAFPSCVPLLRSLGQDCFPLISKSQAQKQENSNDLLNYLRFDQIFQPHDTLVFDGGYIVDSIYRTIIERGLSAVWIRRGLWQSGQACLTPVERKHVFARTIIPGEALDDLNTDVFEDHDTYNVGPIVAYQPLSKKKKLEIRARLRKHFDLNFDRLIVTMLGAGKAANRTAQMQAICNQLKSYPQCLHLIVVWPNATVSPTLFGWPNSYIVRTHLVADLCQASDFVVSAAGYNSFNELLYHKVPTIFIPQMAGYMDDQERRARAASDLGVAVMVLADELLRLREEIASLLGDEKLDELNAALQKLALPELGTVRTASLIEEVSGFGQ